jgi:phosphatidylglycerophosphatase A
LAPRELASVGSRKDLGGVGALDRIAVALATGLGAGLSPIAPGTAGTVVAIPLAYLAAPVATLPYLGVCAVVTGLAIWAAGRADRVMGTHDSGRIVIDEVAGFLVTMAWVERDSPAFLLVGFLLFRVADIVKPWPARRLEREVPGGAGVVLDDVAAGLWASLALVGLARAGLLDWLVALGA